jgi:hypothetical protein
LFNICVVAANDALGSCPENLVRVSTEDDYVCVGKAYAHVTTAAEIFNSTQDFVGRDRWEDSRLVERRFESLASELNSIVVTYGTPAPVAARHVQLTSIAFGCTSKSNNVEQKRARGRLHAGSRGEAGALPLTPAPRPQ